MPLISSTLVFDLRGLSTVVLRGSSKVLGSHNFSRLSSLPRGIAGLNRAPTSFVPNLSIQKKPWCFKTTCVTFPREYSSGGGDSAAPAAGGKEGEVKIKSVLRNSFPNAREIIVEDISGGCGSMYQVYVETSDFQGLSIVKQHQLVNKVLSEEIKAMHGIRIQTEVPK